VPRFGRSLACLVLPLLAAGGPARAADEPAVPSDEVLESEGAVIGRIVIEAKDIFDPDVPGENKRIFRWANAIHPKTRDGTIRSLLLFKAGTPYSRALLEESARVLRSQRYLYDAEIRPTAYENGTVDVLVKTRDVWTLRFGIGLSLAGGATSTHIGIEDSNILGFGKELTFKRDSDVDRVVFMVRYRDPAVAGSRVQAWLEYQDNSDGKVQSFRLGQPFYRLDARWAAEGSALRGSQISYLWDAGVEIDRFEQDAKFAEVYGGWSKGLRGRSVVRTRIGYTYNQQLFAPVLGEPPSIMVPPDRTLAYPWVEIEALREGFVATRNLNKIYRTEDVDLGRSARARIGWMSPAFGADRTGLYTEGALHAGFSLPRQRMAQLDGTFTGRFTTEGPQNVVGTVAVRFFKRWSKWQGTSVSLTGAIARNLDPDVQILIGGDNGLRGYPLRYESGDRSVLLTVEQRFYGQREYAHLIRLGGAAFVDVGGAWYHGTPDPVATRILRDVGVGLRIGSSRSAHAAMLHVDVAVPLDATDTIKKVQLVISTHDTF
jgi:hypothetical protein